MQEATAQCLKHLEIPAVKGSGYNEIRFKVLQNDRPITGANVQLYSQRKLVRAFVTDQQGEFKLSEYSVGKYRLHIESWGNADLDVKDAKDVRFAVDGFILKSTKDCYQLVAF